MYLKQLLLIGLLSFVGCNSQNTPTTMLTEHKYTNDLIHETSPYLLQHAHNPVQWHAWNKETLARAKKEHKMLLISIGYAACHWCHVMEHESFEDEKVAALMNANFICIKVDREERPDVDQVYMDAVQLLTGRGGWPLNCVALPDARPFWGGTYFPKEKWMNVLTEISNLWESNPDKIQEYASQLTQGIKDNALIQAGTTAKDFSNKELSAIVGKWKQSFDTEWGGLNRAPKFPMPNNYHFLLRYAVQSDDKELLTYVNTTLTKMAYGGMYDHVGGGFSRYATDSYWHIPHFEKMLYDNAQLVSLYADAYLVTKNDLYKEVVYETLNFVQRELTDASGVFYSSLDADSENKEGELEEGAYYYWTPQELKELLGTDYNLFKQCYNINDFGVWEGNHYVLIRDKSLVELAITNKMDIAILKKKKQAWKQLLLKRRITRKAPHRDDKILTSWNALMVKAYIDAYRVFGDAQFLEIAQKNTAFYLQKMTQKDGGLYRNYKDGKSNINAYLEDYATIIDALLSLYEVSMNASYLLKAKQFTDYTLDHFFDMDSHLFFFTSDMDAALITRKIAIADNVIPSSNSLMALNLFKLSHYFENSHYAKLSHQMISTVFDRIAPYPPSYSNWLQLILNFTGNFYEVAICGPDAQEKIKELNTYYIPNKLIAGSTTKSNLKLLQDRFSSDTPLYICVNNTCQLPVTDVYKAVQQLKVPLDY